jgi:hypothetical protein
MKITFKDLFSSRGTVDRGTYALVGVVGFAIKHNLDRLLASGVFHRRWDLFNYWVPVRDVARITALPKEEIRLLAGLVALSLPFIWVGVVLTLKRLRSAALPLWMVLIFFFPFVNLLFFLALCIVPERSLEAISESLPSKELYTSSRPSSLARIVPESSLGSAAMSLLLTVPVGVGLTVVGVHVLTTYGWGTFVALPFTMGFGAAIIYGLRQPRSLRACISVAFVSVGLIGLALLGLAFEGFFCLMMAAPLAFPLAILGGACGYLVQRWQWSQTGTPAFFSLLLVFSPVIQVAEHVAVRPTPVYVVHSYLDINAPPEAVWKQVVAFTEIPPPNEWIFRFGIAYPIRAEMIGSGPGAERHCVFSTGVFVEPIQIWDEPRQLKFSVSSNPPAMQEWTPYRHVEPPHLHGFLESEGGQFLLMPLPNGSTRLEGTTWYHHGLWPAAYWRIWSDAIIHRIHMRVLKHIRGDAERTALWRERTQR